ncbi:MAG: hypothetical protein C9356_10615 [Oleiphilus sp.]|nr:MAG: hypothetical protein C9356_10615 [Oleiphilus sp.]
MSLVLSMRLSFKVLTLSLLSLALIACVATYKAAEEGVAGYRDLRIDRDTYYVEYTEAARVDWEQLHSFVLKRCAEIAKENGYAYFDVLEKDEKTVFLKSNVDEIEIMAMGEVQTYPAGARLEGKRVTYKIKLLRE